MWLSAWMLCITRLGSESWIVSEHVTTHGIMASLPFRRRMASLPFRRRMRSDLTPMS